MAMSDINRELAENAAEEYYSDPLTRENFANGWMWFCEGLPFPDTTQWQNQFAAECFTAGYIAARDAPE